MSRPIGILPGGKVFHVPPPAVEASAPEESVGAGCACATVGAVVATGGAVAGGADGTGIGDAAATTIGDFATGGGLVRGMAVGAATATGDFAAAGASVTGIAVATCIGGGVTDCFTMVGAFGTTDGAGVGF